MHPLVIIPLVVAVIVAIVAQLRGATFWRPCFVAGIVFAGMFFVYLVVLAVVLGLLEEGGGIQLVVTAVIRWMFVAAIGGIVAFTIAALVGLPLAADRWLERKRHDDEKV